MKVNDLDVTVKSDILRHVCQMSMVSILRLFNLRVCVAYAIQYFILECRKLKLSPGCAYQPFVYCVYLGGHLSSDISPGDQAGSMHPTGMLSCSRTWLSLSLARCHSLLWRIVSGVFRWDLCCFLGD